MIKYIIGITGASGSGKSYIANKIIQKSPVPALIFDQDNYFYPADKQPKDKNGKPNFDTPQSLDLGQFENDFFDLLSGKTITHRRYSYNKPITDNVYYKSYIPKPVLIVEGIFALYSDKIREKCDITIFVESDLELNKQRRIKRDSEERGYDAEDVIYKFENHIIDSYNKYILPLKSQVDLVILNSGGKIGVMRE